MSACAGSHVMSVGGARFLPPSVPPKLISCYFLNADTHVNFISASKGRSDICAKENMVKVLMEVTKYVVIEQLKLVKFGEFLTPLYEETPPPQNESM